LAENENVVEETGFQNVSKKCLVSCISAIYSLMSVEFLLPSKYITFTIPLRFIVAL